ncbi:hypothetical protein BDV12DRAFT_177646 [Aspergillus spectabilis]
MAYVFIESLVSYSRLLLTIVASLALLLLTGLSVYRLFFHPYAKYPGLLLARLTSWYAVYHAYLGDLHIDIWNCHPWHSILPYR